MGSQEKRRADRLRRGETGFGEWYSGHFGERWPDLEAALRLQPRHVGMECLAGGGLVIHEADEAASSTQPRYHLDRASVIAAESLVLPDRGRILDACAAPGGKSLVLAARLAPEARLVANELSADRRRRLKDVLDTHLPPERRALVSVMGRDAATLCREVPEAFGAILLDAPCSSERHVLADTSALADWSPARIRSLAIRQWALLSSAWRMLSPGGCLIYATCALSSEENDAVIARLIDKFGTNLRCENPDTDIAEKTEFGLHFLPDTGGGCGPLYLCRVFKNTSDGE